MHSWLACGKGKLRLLSPFRILGGCGAHLRLVCPQREAEAAMKELRGAAAVWHSAAQKVTRRLCSRVLLLCFALLPSSRLFEHSHAEALSRVLSVASAGAVRAQPQSLPRGPARSGAGLRPRAGGRGAGGAGERARGVGGRERGAGAVVCVHGPQHARGAAAGQRVVGAGVRLAGAQGLGAWLALAPSCSFSSATGPPCVRCQLSAPTSPVLRQGGRPLCGTTSSCRPRPLWLSTQR